MPGAFTFRYPQPVLDDFCFMIKSEAYASGRTRAHTGGAYLMVVAFASYGKKHAAFYWFEPASEDTAALVRGRLRRCLARNLWSS